MTRLTGPDGKIKYNPGSQYHVLFGDEPCLSLCLGMTDIIYQNGREYSCFPESDQEHKNWVETAGISAETCEKSFTNPAEDAVGQLEEFIKPESKCWSLWQHATFYLTGRARSIQVFRKALNTKGVNTEPYWAEGKTVCKSCKQRI